MSCNCAYCSCPNRRRQVELKAGEDSLHSECTCLYHRQALPFCRWQLPQHSDCIKWWVRSPEINPYLQGAQYFMPFLYIFVDNSGAPTSPFHQVCSPDLHLGNKLPFSGTKGGCMWPQAPTPSLGVYGTVLVLSTAKSALDPHPLWNVYTYLPSQNARKIQPLSKLVKNLASMVLLWRQCTVFFSTWLSLLPSSHVFIQRKSGHWTAECFNFACTSQCTLPKAGL